MCKKLICLMGLVLLLVMSSLVFAQTYPGKIGVGIGMGWNLPFVDAAKELRAFENIDRTPAATDSQGWPTTDAMTVLWDLRPVAAWFGTIDDPEEHIPDVSGTYKCSFNGQATLSVFEGNFLTANQVYDSGTNTTTFDLIVPADADCWNNLVFIIFSDTKRTAGSATNTGITNLKAIRPGYPHDTAQIFHTPFINAIRSAEVGGLGASFSTWRTLGWVGSNNANPPYPEQVEWAQRKLWTDATQATWGSKLETGCWESVIWLSNTANIDPWITIPIHASDDYITQLATLFKNNLNPDRNVYVEWSNEVWNGLFWQTAYNSQMGAAVGLNNIEHYAKRTVEISNIFKNVWGASAINTRVRVMSCWHGEAAFQQQMNYINNNFGPPNQFIYAIASANYLDVRETGVLEYGTVQEILDGMWAKSDSWIPYRQTCTAIASDYALPGGHCAYEGGSDTGGGSTANLPNRIAAERSAGMGDVYLHDLLDNWFPHGGGLYMYLEVTSPYQRYGCWGLTDDVTDPDRNSKFAAVREILGDPPRPPGQATSPSPANLAVNVPVNKTLTWTAGSRATSHYVYFGTTSPGTFRGSQTETTYNPGTLANGVTYYWRIDGQNDTGTTTGAVWSFSTVAEGVRTMDVIIAADDGYDLYVNGQYKGSSASWTHAQTYNWIAPLTGENVVAVRGVNAYLSGGMLAELIIDGSRVGTDTSWKVSLSPDTGWQSPGFDDSGWANASDLGAYGGPPWGTDVVDMPTDTPAHWIWSSGADTPVYMRYKFTFGAQPPCQATNPGPANGATYVSTTAGLSWTAGTGAASHDVYFGTAGSPPFIGNQAGSTYNPGTLAASTTYYWRINEKNASGTTIGTVWSFTTMPVTASNPSPANGATYVSTTADLSWMPGAGATSHDVYFGQSSPGTFQGNQSGTTFDPGTLAGNTTYYWRIDEKNAGGTEVGVVWSFTTLPPPGQATNPSPVNTATAVSTTAGLSWTAGSGATSHDVYFGTVNPPPFVGTQTATMYDTGTMAYSTTYYWQIDEKNAAGTTAGLVWTFTTRSSPPPTPVQLLVWDLVGVTGGASSTADVFDQDISTTAPSGVATIGPGLTPSTSFDGLVASNLNANNLNQAKQNDEYFSWTITPESGYQMSLTSIELRALSQGTLRTFALLSSVDGFDNTIDSVTSSSTSPPLETINLTGHENLTGAVEFRLYVYPWGSTYETLGIGNMTGDDLIVNGTVTAAGPVLPGQASNPSPANSATDVSTTPTLSWTAGSGATSHDVYFGTVIPPPFKVNQTETTYNPGTLASDTIYYWRIDEKNAAGTMTGVDWSFTTVATGLPGQASNPSPANGATSVNINADLSWTAGSGATSHDVYFGTVSSPPFIGNQAGTTFDPGTLANSTTYYWQIDEKNANGTTTGSVWSFTTEASTPLPGQASNPSPANGAAGVNINADLSWTAGSGATSHDVYFGQSSPGTFQGNQAGTTFDPGTLANSTTYYWRIDSVNAIGTTTGVVWSFTTEAAAAAVTVTVNPAVQYQLIEGWGACYATSIIVTDARAKDAYRNLGCNLLRVQIEPSALMAPGGNLWGPFVDLTADIDENITKFNFEQSRAWFWDDVVTWLAANALEPERVKIIAACWSPPNWAKAPTGTYIPGMGVTPFVAYCDTCDSVGGTWDDGTFGWNAYQYCSRFLAAWCKGFSQHCGGIPLYGLNIQNELAFESPFNSCSLYNQARAEQIEQEGIFDPNIYANALKAVKDEFNLHPELASIKIFGPDHASLGENPGNPWSLLFQTLGVQAVKDHSDPELINFLGTYSHNYSAPAAKRAEMFNAHWEGIDSMPGESWAAWQYPATMHAGIGGDGKQVWNEEFGGHFPTSWSNMLDMAGDMHCQLVWGHESAIIHWAFCEDTLTQHNLLATSQLDNPEQSMKYSTFKQFSRYIRPGAKCVDATFSNGSSSYGGDGDMDVENALNVSAYIHETDGRVTIVFVNMRSSSEAVTINVPTSPDVTTYNVYRSTSSDRFAQQPDLNVSGGQVSLTVPAQSIVTLTGTGPVAPQPPGQASNPSPADGATGVSTTADLSWTAGSGATSHDVYFGQTTSPPFIQNQADTTYNPGTLSEVTTYYWRIDEKNAEGTTAGAVWSFTTGAVDTTPPAAPTGLTATAGDTTVDLDWTDNTEPDLSHYNVKRSTTTTGPYTQIATNVTVSAYTNTGLTNGATYYYVVTALDTSSNESGNSNEASATPTGPPPPPTQLLVWDLVGVSGSASSTADLFDADISTTAPSGVASIASGLTPGFTSFPGLVAYNLNANTLAEAKANNEYFSWTITPESDKQMSITSIELRALSQNTSRTFNLLSSVDGFTTSIGSVTSSSTSPTLQTINVTGHDNLTGAVEFRLYVYPSVNTYETLGIGDMTGDDLIVNGTTGTAGPPDTTPPAAPTGLTATAGDSQVSLDWADNTEPDLAGYNVKRSTTTGGPYTQIASNVTVSNYTNTTLTNGTTYYYVVTAVDTSSNESGNSNEDSATPEGVPDTTPPADPTGLAATAGDAQVSLDWADNTEPDMAHYNVYRDTTSGGPYTQIASNVTVSNYTNTGLTNGTTYYYVVTAVDTSSNESGNSNEASATPQAGPPPPEQQLLVWDLDYAGGSASSTADVFDPDISTTAPSGVASIGPGLIPYGASFDGLVAYFLNANNLNQAKANDEYFSWTITPNSGKQMSITSIDLRALSQNTSRTFNLFSSADGFTTSIGSVLGDNTSPTLQTINVTGYDNLTGAVEFRLYVYPGGNPYETLGIGDMAGDDLIVNGTAN